MISDLTMPTAPEPAGTPAAAALAAPASGLLVPHGTPGALTTAELPVTDIPAYLSTRNPVPSYELEPRLFCRLPFDLRAEVRRLQAAMAYALALTTGRAALKVQAACRRTLAIYAEFGPLKTFRGKFDLWRREQDWLVLVNRARAGAAWQSTRRGLPDVFLDYVAARLGEYKRGDAGTQAILSIHRQWATGRNHRGVAEPIPGYTANWAARQTARLPAGWEKSNLRKQLKARAKFGPAVKALLHEGSAAARAFLPRVHGTRAGLRFLEVVQFDDVRCDFDVMDTATGEVCDLWLLIARDVATGMLLGFGMRPARRREDGSQEHLKLRDMKQLCGWLLECYGLPPYPMTWVLENGTATLETSVRAALAEMLGDRIDFRMGSMIGGKSAVGYIEKRFGNSAAKAMLESLNRLMHMMASHFPGQIGANYAKLPAEFYARKKEAEQIWATLRGEDRAEARYPFYTIPQAREGLFEIFGIQNRRSEHRMEGFKTLAEWFDGTTWQPAQLAPADMRGVPTRTRMESPVERAGRLLQDCEPFTRVSPEIITAFYEHSQRRRPVEANGQIEFMHEGKLLRFAPPAPEFALSPGTVCLCYFNPDDPRFLTLTDGRGGILGTWLRRGLVQHGDHDAVAAAIRHSATALRSAQARASELAAGELADLQAMRAHNATLAPAGTDFVTVAEPGRQTQMITSPVAAHQTALRGEQAATKKQQQRRAEDERIAREALEL